ncbi:universal stress protein [Naumannella huperziae]
MGYVPTELGNVTLVEAMREASWRSTALVAVNFARDDVLADPHLINTGQEAALRARLDAADARHELLLPRHGSDAATVLIDIAERRQAELVVIGLRHRSAVGKLLMGSTAQRVLLGAPCPVLGVRASHD